MCPEGWKWKELREIAQFKNGLNFPATAKGRGLKIVGVGDFKDRLRIGLGSLDRVAGFDDIDSDALLQDGDLLFVRSNGNRNLIGRVLYMEKVKERVSHTGFTIRARVNGDRTLRLYLAHFFHAGLARKQFTRLGGGTNISNLSQGILGSVQVPIPPRREREAVNRAIETWNGKIAKCRRLVDAKRKLKKGLMQQLLTGKRRFPEFVQSKGTRKGRYFDVPNDWKTVRIGDIGEEVNKRNGMTDGIPVLSCTKHDGLVESLKYFGRRVFSDDLSNYKVVREGQFAYATNHIEEGSIGLLESIESGLISPMYTVFEMKRPAYAPYFYLLFKTELFRHIFEANTNASVNRRGSLRWNQFRNLHIPLPSMDEQRKIADCILTFQKEIDLLERQVDGLRKQKQGLMQQLLTGRIRISVDAGKESRE